MVRISACHVEGPGSIPGRGENFFLHQHQAHECPENRHKPPSPFGRPFERPNMDIHSYGDMVGEAGKKKILATRGIEPVTFALLARRSNQLS